MDSMDGTDQPGTFDIAGLAKDLDLALAQAAISGHSDATLRRKPMKELSRKPWPRALAGFDGASLTRHLFERLIWIFSATL